MKSFHRTAAILAYTLLVACGGGRGFSPSLQAGSGARTPQTTAWNETILHRFQGGTDGAVPAVAAPLYLDGILYGTTTYGGSSACAVSSSPAGCGTVFRIDSSGSGYKVLHRFQKTGTEGNTVWAGLSTAKGTLYGTTEWGGGQGDSYQQCFGNAGCGTLFELDPSNNKFKSLHSFGGSDGMNVRPGAVDAGGTLYGATAGNGAGSSSACIGTGTGCGVIYKFANGTETVLHAFTGSPDGYTPFYSPIAVGGDVYGATLVGGHPSPECTSILGNGCGVIYHVSASGQYNVIYLFKGGKDGYSPASVVFANGKLYGTTYFGGNSQCSEGQGIGCGIVFELSTKGTGFRTLYRFTGHSDGWFPNPLSAVSGNNIYVSTENGGDGAGCGSGGCGTVIQIATSGGSAKVLYQFQGGSNDGGSPDGVVEEDGTIYGTTFIGGGTGCGGGGCGTVFELTP